MYEHIDLAKIPVFLTVAECLSFTEAAYQLYMTQSSVSKSISALEASVGFSLFVRENRKIALTQEGNFLLHSLKNCMNEIDKALIYASKIREGNSGTLTIGVSGYLPKTPQFENICFQFTDQFANHELDLQYLHYSKLRKNLLDERSDAILINHKDISMLRGYRYIPIMEGSAVLAYNQYSHIKKTDIPYLSDMLKDLQFVCLNPNIAPNYYGYLAACCHAYGFQPKITKYVDSIQEIIHCISTSKYVTVFDKTIFPMDFSDLNILPLPKQNGMPEPLKTILIWKKENINPTLLKFVESATDRLSEKIYEI